MTAVVNDILCYGISSGNINITVTGGTGVYTYMWSPPPAGGNSNYVGNLPSNTYTASVTDMNGCPISNTFTINNPTQIIVATGSLPTKCGKDNGEVSISNVSGGTPGYTFTWQPQTGQTASNGTMDSLAAGTYLLTVTDANNCKLVDNSKVGNTAVPILLPITTTSAKCFGDSSGSAKIIIKYGVPSFTPFLIPSTGSGSIDTTVFSYYNLPADNYTIQVIDGNGCSVNQSFTINQPTPMSLYVSSYEDSLCIGAKTNLSVVAQGGTPPYTYLWTDTTLQYQYIQTQVVEGDTTTSYTVVVHDYNNCPDDTALFDVFVYPPLLLSVNPTETSICKGQTVDVTLTMSGGMGAPYNYFWSDLGYPMTENVRPLSPIDTMSYNIFGIDGCNTISNTVSTVVNIKPIPLAKIHGDTINGCSPLTVNFNNISHETGYVYSWDFDDNSATSSDSMPIYTFYDDGKYDIYLTVTSAEGCSKVVTASNYIEVYPHPQAMFSLSPDVVKLLEDPAVNFWDESFDASKWLWQFGDGDISYSQDTSHQYNEAGIFNVLLTVWNEQGCSDTISHPLQVLENYTFYAPNAFTPESRYNDYFFFKGTGIDKDNFQLYIYDRWGELIFETNVFYEPDYNPDTRGRWDGKVKNGSKIAETGVYTWYVIYKDVNGKSHDQTGAVTLIR